MEKESSFFSAQLGPMVEEIENVSQAFSSVCEQTEEGMCFLLRDTLNRIAKEFRAKIEHLDREFVVSKKGK